MRRALGPIAAGAARVALGGFWLHEGLFKYHAGFGTADIRLVADSADQNPRAPGYFVWFADHVLRPAAGVFGVAMPLLETALGVALVLGIATLLAAAGSVLTLTSYWAADQLIGQYPAMLLLSLVPLLWPAAAARYSATVLLPRRLRPACPPARPGCRTSAVR